MGCFAFRAGIGFKMIRLKPVKVGLNANGGGGGRNVCHTLEGDAAARLSNTVAVFIQIWILQIHRFVMCAAASCLHFGGKP